jgi:predicted nuclease with TOPRIM domain
MKPVKQQLEQRLQSLKSEYEAGQKMLAELEVKQASVCDTLLRISGAIQVLEEMLNPTSDHAEEVANLSGQGNHT